MKQLEQLDLWWHDSGLPLSSENHPQSWEIAIGGLQIFHVDMTDWFSDISFTKQLCGQAIQLFQATEAEKLVDANVSAASVEVNHSYSIHCGVTPATFNLLHITFIVRHLLAVYCIPTTTRRVQTSITVCVHARWHIAWQYDSTATQFS